MSMHFWTKNNSFFRQMLNKIANLFISLPPVEVLKHSIGDVLYCCFSGVKSFFLCLLTNKGSTKEGGGPEQIVKLGCDSIKSAPKINRGQVHLILEN